MATFYTYNPVHSTLSLVHDGRPYNITKDHPAFETILQKLRDKDYASLSDSLDVRGSISKMIEIVPGVEIDGDELIFYGNKRADSLARAIISTLCEGLDPEPLANFMKKVDLITSKSLRDELFDWLSNGDFTITAEGNFLAFKIVNKDDEGRYWSVHSEPDGSHREHVFGVMTSMDRRNVCDDRRKTCSRGLHFCSLEYLPNYGLNQAGRAVIAVEIDPRDVVSIPVDYGYSKGRTWVYTPVFEVPKENLQSIFRSKEYIYNPQTSVGTGSAEEEDVEYDSVDCDYDDGLYYDGFGDEEYFDDYYPW